MTILENMLSCKYLSLMACRPIVNIFSSMQTYIGSILVSVNPYQLFNIYGTDVVLRYEGHGLGDNPP